jgi:hypothetical protein
MKSLHWWLLALQRQPGPWRPLFVKPDGFLDVFDGKTFPEPWSIPTDHHGASRLSVITIDASASGFGFVVGDPAAPVFKFAAAFTCAQSLNTSNWREAKAMVYALAALTAHRSVAVSPGSFIIFRSDNTSAVAVVNKETSKSPALHLVGRELVGWAQQAGAQLAATHIAGTLNVVADGLSREAEALYARRVLTPAGRAWLANMLTRQGLTLGAVLDVTAPGYVGIRLSHRVSPAPLGHGRPFVAVSIPPPATMEASIRASGNVHRQGWRPALLLPLSADAAPQHRWGPLLGRLGFVPVAQTFPQCPIFEPLAQPSPDATYDSTGFSFDNRTTLFLWVSTY